MWKAIVKRREYLPDTVTDIDNFNDIMELHAPAGQWYMEEMTDQFDVMLRGKLIATYMFDDTPPPEPVALDENGHDARYEDWLTVCGMPHLELASDGERVMSAKALQIAADMLHHILNNRDGGAWNESDIRLALGAIAGIRAQQGDFPGEGECHLTNFMDICIYG